MKSCGKKANHLRPRKMTSLTIHQGKEDLATFQSVTVCHRSILLPLSFYFSLLRDSRGLSLGCSTITRLGADIMSLFLSTTQVLQSNARSIFLLPHGIQQLVQLRLMATESTSSQMNTEPNLNMGQYPFPKHKNPTPHEIFHLRKGCPQDEIKKRCTLPYSPVPHLANSSLQITS